MVLVANFAVFANALAQVCDDRSDIFLYIAVDFSGSMAGAGQIGASNFGVGLFDDLNATGELDRAGAFAFSDVLMGEVVPTNNTILVRDFMLTVATGTTGGGTSLFDAIIIGANVAAAQSSSFERLLVVLTDGEDTSSTNSQSTAASVLSSAGVNTELIFIGSSGSAPAPRRSSILPPAPGRASTPAPPPREP